MLLVGTVVGVLPMGWRLGGKEGKQKDLLGKYCSKIQVSVNSDLNQDGRSGNFEK